MFVCIRQLDWKHVQWVKNYILYTIYMTTFLRHFIQNTWDFHTEQSIEFEQNGISL